MSRKTFKINKIAKNVFSRPYIRDLQRQNHDWANFNVKYIHYSIYTFQFLHATLYLHITEMHIKCILPLNAPTKWTTE